MQRHRWSTVHTEVPRRGLPLGETEGSNTLWPWLTSTFHKRLRFSKIWVVLPDKLACPMLIPGGLEPGESHPKLNPLICTMCHLELLLNCICLSDYLSWMHNCWLINLSCSLGELFVIGVNSCPSDPGVYYHSFSFQSPVKHRAFCSESLNSPAPHRLRLASSSRQWASFLCFQNLH